MKRILFVAFALAFVFAMSPGARADTFDMFDNISAPPGTFALLTYFGYQHYGEVDVDGDSVDIPKLDIGYVAFRPIYYLPKIFGHSWGFNGVLPFSGISQHGFDSSVGIGDIVISPFIYLYENCHNNIYLSFWEFITAPTGKYDETKALNNGYDAWWFEHQIAFGWYPGKFGFETNVNWWQKQESSELEIDYQDAIESEGVIHYGLTDKLRIGLHWDFWWDLDELEIGDAKIDNTREKIYRVGGAVMYFVSDKVFLSFRYLYDIEAENALKGHWAYARVAWIF